MFEKGQFVSFGFRSSDSLGRRRGWGAWSTIPRYYGRIESITEKSVVVKPEKRFSEKNYTFTLRKSGNWVMAGHADDAHGRMNLEVVDLATVRLESGVIDFAREQGVDLLPEVEKVMLKKVAELQNELTQAKYDMELDAKHREYLVYDISHQLKLSNDELLSVRAQIKETA